MLRISGRTGEVVFSAAYDRQALDSDPKGAQWVRLDQGWLAMALERDLIKTTLEYKCFLHVVSKVRFSGVAEINQSELARKLGLSGPKAINRAMVALVERGVLQVVDEKKRGYVVTNGVLKGKSKAERRS